MKEQNRIVVFANQKGGVGKSTLCMMFANFLAEKGEAVAVIDADLQQTIFEQRQSELAASPKEEVPWDVVSVDTTVLSNVENAMKMAITFPGTILIDVPGNISDDNLLPIYANANYIISPITYHPNVINSTKKFAEIMEKVKAALNVDFKMWFVPNMIDDRKKLNLDELKHNAWEALHRHGEILTRINNRAWLERTSSLSLTSQQIGSVKYAFGRIITEITEIEE
jgi:ATPases involved in chromosome partitioning